jgi:hypothetical protein
MRKREIERRERILMSMFEQIRKEWKFPDVLGLAMLDLKEWRRLPCSERERSMLSAGLQASVRQHRIKYCLVMTKNRKGTEERAIALHGYPSYKSVEQLRRYVGAMFELVPYAKNDRDREFVLRYLWPATAFQDRFWRQIQNLASVLGEDYAIAHGSHPDSDCDEDFLRDWDDPLQEAPELEERESALATIVESPGREPSRLADVPQHIDPRLREFVLVFGRKGVRRLGQSNRLSVALAVCSDFWRLEAGDSRWRSFANFLGAVEALVAVALACGLDARYASGDPLSATISDLRRLTITAPVLNTFHRKLESDYRAVCAESLGDDFDGTLWRPSNERQVKTLQDSWDRIYKGVPALRELVNEYLFPGRHGCVVERQFAALPPRRKLGPMFVEPDSEQLDVYQAARLFCFGCSVLAEGDSRVLRSWLSLWLGALRPRESYPLKQRLVPFGDGLIVVITRSLGKTGAREAVFPGSGLRALGLSTSHFGEESDGVLSPAELAAEACRRVRDAWASRQAEGDEGDQFDIPDRLSYFVRKLMTDIIRQNGRDPLPARILGHEHSASDTSYTQLAETDSSQMYDFVREALSSFVGNTAVGLS